MSDDTLPLVYEKLVTAVAKLTTNFRVAFFIYYGVIVMFGYFILTFLSKDAFPFTRSLLLMSFWLILIILLDPPKEAILESEPFADLDIIS